MKVLIWLTLLGSAFAQIPCPSNETLNLPPDGPSAAPKACINTSLPVTKSAVAISLLSTLPTALKCGTVVSLKPGRYGSIILPKCSAGNWLILKSSGKVPAPGARFVPGMGYQTAVFDHITAGSYNRLGPGIEVLQAVEGGYDSTLLDARNDSHVELIRSWIHGTATGEVGHAFIANGSDHIAVSGNTISEIHCKAGSTGKCSDAQGFLAGCGNSGAGFLIENNYIEASTEGILFGGCGATTSATDAIVRRNHIVKPLRWMQGQSDFVGIRFTVKNCFEAKNVQRLLFEDNLCENSWGGFSQDGYSVLLTAKNQTGQAPTASVADVIVRFNHLIGGSGIQFAAAKDTPPPLNASSLGTVNASIHDNLVEVDPKFIDSRGLDLQLTLQDDSPSAKFTNINVSNNTWTGATNAALMLGGHVAGSLTISKNIFFNGKFGSVANSSNVGDCAANLNTKALQALNACWAGYTFVGNVVVGGTSALWPPGTSVPTLSPLNPDFSSLIPGVGVDIPALNLALASVN